METNFIKIYIELNKLLCKTLCVKSSTNATVINDNLNINHKKYNNGPVNNNPNTWKYYKNIYGEYHYSDEYSINDNEQYIKVISIDNGDKIDFTKETLIEHPVTKSVYSYGSSYYRELLLKYPDKELLILGILYPANIKEYMDPQIVKDNPDKIKLTDEVLRRTDELVAQNTPGVPTLPKGDYNTIKNIDEDIEDGTILSYPKHLIEVQEITLINDLETYIKEYITRWDVKAFGVTDNLYPAAQQGIMFLNIFTKLLNLRLDRCKTNEVHSFHIREYLASHNKLDKYLEYLTLKQSLFLYRNIKYIQRNSGSVKQLNLLVNKFLTDRFIPIDELTSKQINEFNPDTYLPEITIKRTELNKIGNRQEKKVISFETFVNRESKLSPDNKLYYSHNSAAVKDKFTKAYSSVTQTKVLESNTIDYFKSNVDNLSEVILREWAYTSLNGLYDTIVSFEDTVNFRTIKVSSKTAFIYFYYLTLKQSTLTNDLPLTIMPNYLIIKHKKLLKDLSVDNFLSYIGNKETYRTYVNEMFYGDNGFIRIDEVKKLKTVNNFYNYARKVYTESKEQWYKVSDISDMNDRGHVFSAILSLYSDTDTAIDLGSDSNGAPITDINVFLSKHNLPLYEDIQHRSETFIREIFIKSTGVYKDVKFNLKNIQEAMIEIVSQLSSYSIQIFKDINANRVIPVAWSVIRTSEVNTGVAVNSLYKETLYFHAPVLLYMGGPFTRSKIEPRVDILGSIINVNTNEQAILGHYYKLKDIFNGPVSSFTPDVSDEILQLSYEDKLNITSDVKFNHYNKLINQNKVEIYIDINKPYTNILNRFSDRGGRIQDENYKGLSDWLGLTPKEQQTIKTVH